MRHMDNTLFYIPLAIIAVRVATISEPANANLFRFYTYENRSRNSCRICTYETVMQPYQTTRL